MEKMLNKIQKDKQELAKSYNVNVSSIVWIGNNKYIVKLENGEEIRI
jgi:hypothetical protein